MTDASANVGESITMLPSSTTATLSGQKNVASVELALIKRSPTGMPSMFGSSDCASCREAQRERPLK